MNADNIIDVKAIINKRFPQDKYSASSASEEINTWLGTDLTRLCVELGQKKLSKGLSIHLIREFILYTRGLIDYEKLISNPFIVSSKFKI